MIFVHRHLGGGLLSQVWAIYLLRRMTEPLIPSRLKARLIIRLLGDVNPRLTTATHSVNPPTLAAAWLACALHV